MMLSSKFPQHTANCNYRQFIRVSDTTLSWERINKVTSVFKLNKTNSKWLSKMSLINQKKIWTFWHLLCLENLKEYTRCWVNSRLNCKHTRKLRIQLVNPISQPTLSSFTKKVWGRHRYMLTSILKRPRFMDSRQSWRTQFLLITQVGQKYKDEYATRKLSN